MILLHLALLTNRAERRLFVIDAIVRGFIWLISQPAVWLVAGMSLCWFVIWLIRDNRRSARELAVHLAMLKSRRAAFQQRKAQTQSRS